MKLMKIILNGHTHPTNLDVFGNNIIHLPATNAFYFIKGNQIDIEGYTILDIYKNKGEFVCNANIIKNNQIVSKLYKCAKEESKKNKPKYYYNNY